MTVTVTFNGVNALTSRVFHIEDDPESIDMHHGGALGIRELDGTATFFAPGVWKWVEVSK